MDQNYLEANSDEQRLLADEIKYADDPIRLHFTYNSLIELYQKSKLPDARVRCLDYCKKDFNIYSKFKLALQNEWPDRPNVLPKSMPSADILIRENEQSANLPEASRLCDEAIAFGLDYFVEDKKRIEMKITLSKSYQNYTDYALDQVKSIVQRNPGINKGTLLKKLQSDSLLLLEEAHKYLDESVTKNIIKQEKQGRSLIHSIV
ncbi:hypothetical protein J25TS5_15260 [Paenibacillus faecis]|uniref:hypothetical protein n=1 Tax=Paenibacillus faecis TaxID=862114 RepID=UPI001AFE509B|nr:hypothetical protein [Paenibacillus faecis]GIO84594.1 hypothetical protein J25TS5_15260 [Paenibacillus faecis]